MIYLVLTTPEIIKREQKVEKSSLNYFDLKILEFKEDFVSQCQNSYLNNGAIEIFLKIANKGGKYFQQNILMKLFIFLLPFWKEEIQIFRKDLFNYSNYYLIRITFLEI